MINIGQVPAGRVDRQRAASASVAVVLIAMVASCAVSRPLGVSFPLLALVMGISIAMLAMAAALLWAQGRVTRSLPLLCLATVYLGTAIVMIPYLALYRGLFPEFARFVSADPQAVSWLWFESHMLFASSPAVYALARRAGSVADDGAFRKLQYQLLGGMALIATVLVVPLLRAHGLPAVFRDGRLNELASVISMLVVGTTLAALGVLIATTRLRAVLDLWLAVSSICLIADVALSTFGSSSFTFGWYFARLYIFVASGLVFAALVAQTARVYVHAAEAAERLRGESLTDALTGIANRRNLDLLLSQIVADGKRSSWSVGVLLIDIDHFKMYNDLLGHQAGDDALRNVATTLAAGVNRGRDVVARYGGEEFVVVLPETEVAGALVVAERLREAVEPTGVTISIGVAVSASSDFESPDTVLARADRALYAAKDGGRNRICYTSAVQVTAATAETCGLVAGRLASTA